MIATTNALGDPDKSPGDINPFRPTFGAPPLKWVGRSLVLEHFRAGLDSGVGSPYRAMLISGHRGMGKTVLLSELEDIAEQLGWAVIRISGRTHSIDELVDSIIPHKIDQIVRPARRRVKDVRIAGIGGIGTEEASQPPQPTLELRLRELYSHLHDSGVLITIDEVQDALPDDLERIAVAFQHLVRDQYGVAIAMAGLTAGIDQLLRLPGTTFLRRASKYTLGPINAESARRAFIDTAAETSIACTDDAAHAAAKLSHGYPYLIQLIGYLAWQAASTAGGRSITSAVIDEIRPEAIHTMGIQVHDPAVKALPQRQLEYLRTCAELADDAGETASGAVAGALGVATTALSDTRAKLIAHGLIDAPRHGIVRLALPYLREFLLGAEPEHLVD